MTVAETTELIKVLGDLLIGLGAVTGAVMGVVNHYGIREVKAQTNGLVEQGRKDARAAGRQDQKNDDASDIAAR